MRIFYKFVDNNQESSSSVNMVSIPPFCSRLLSCFFVANHAYLLLFLTCSLLPPPHSCLLLSLLRHEMNKQSSGGYFRAHARNEAHFNRKLCGALKELGGGHTEIIVEGKTSAIRSFLRWCKKGPGVQSHVLVLVRCAKKNKLLPCFQ